ncbi:MAG TPA: EAL domain-containing protein [Candidatus Dormibacteraeota bacterium]
MISALQTRLADSLARAQEAEDSLAVLHVALGRPVSGTPTWAGGELSTLLVGALRAVVRVTDSVVCTDEQEAWILLPGCDFDGAAGAADRIAAAIEDLEPAVGIAIYPDHAAQPAWLARHAEVASTLARNSHSPLAFADPQDEDPPGADVIHELPEALRERHLVAHYQPLLELSTRKVVGVEALVRWDHPERGLLEPAAFLPMAQVTRLGVEIDLEMLRIAANQAADWVRKGRRLPITVKICARTLTSPGLLPHLREMLARTGADASLLTIQVHEETVTLDPGAAARLGELRDAGFRICVDSFGGGPASLAAVERLPVDELKLDPALVHLAKDPRQVGSLASIVAGSHALGLQVCATHLDSDTLVRATWGLGCDLGQGFALARPVPASELGEIEPVAAPAAAKKAPAAAEGKILRLPSLPRARLAPGALRLGSAAAFVAAGMLIASVPLGTTTLAGTIAGFFSNPPAAAAGAHQANAPAAAGANVANGNRTAGSSGSGHTTGATSSSSGRAGSGTSGAGSTGTGTQTTGTGSGGSQPLPLPSGLVPSPFPLPVPSPSTPLLP